MSIFLDTSTLTFETGHTGVVNNIDRAQRALEDADQRLEDSVKDALAAGINIDSVAQALTADSPYK